MNEERNGRRFFWAMKNKTKKNTTLIWTRVYFFLRVYQHPKLLPKSARKKPSCWCKANKDKECRSGILPLCIKTDMRAAVTMEAAGCHFYALAIPYVRI